MESTTAAQKVVAVVWTSAFFTILIASLTAVFYAEVAEGKAVFLLVLNAPSLLFLFLRQDGFLIRNNRLHVIRLYLPHQNQC